MTEEWVNHAFSKSQEAENKLANSDRALAEVEKKYKDSIFHLAKAERGRQSAKAALMGAKKQAKEMRVSLKKTETQLALTKKQIKLQVKELGNKDAKREKAKQAAYDESMAKIA